MKTKLILTSGILALALLAATPCAFAQASGVPNSISYQGRISDENGILVGNPAPVNRTVIFRVWDSPSATAPVNLLYSEQQIVTIASGEFNVLVGQGAPVGTEPKPAFDAVFNGNGAQRFLGVTVDDGTAAADPEITPRQQLVTSAFAFRARTAEGVTANAITPSMLAAGAVTANSIAANTIDSTKLATGAVLPNIAANSIDSTKLAAGAVTTASIATGAVTNASIAANAIDSSKLADGSVSAAKLDPGIAFWNAQGGNVYRASGNVGIGMGTPGALLHLHSTTPLSERIRLSGASYQTSVTGAPTDGISFLMGVSQPANKQLWLADSTQLNPSNNNTALRFVVGYPMAIIDAVSTNGDTYKDLAICPNGGSVGIAALPNVNYKLYVGGQGGFSGFVYSPGYITTSDARIKSVIGRSNPHSDLELVRKLQVTDYRMIDEKTHGGVVQKGFIAQEVQQIVPEAVMKSPMCAIPSIHAPATKATTTYRRGRRSSHVAGRRSWWFAGLHVVRRVARHAVGHRRRVRP